MRRMVIGYIGQTRDTGTESNIEIKISFVRSKA
jgi:hypothetical protein